MSTRFEADHLWIGDGTPVLSPGVVDVDRGRVVWSGPAPQAPDPAGPDRVRPDRTRVAGQLMPGFVDIHCHTPMVLFRGAGEGLSVQRWLTEVIWPREARLTPDDVYWGMTLGAAELLSNGVTTSVEMYFHPEQVIRAATGAGLRCVVTPPVIEGDGLGGFGSVDRQLASAVSLAGEWRDSPMIDIGLGPHSAYAVSDAVLREVARGAASEDLLVHIHLAEQSDESDVCRRRNGRSLLDCLEATGLLDRRLIAAHGVWLTDDDQLRLAEAAVGIAHCPASNGRHASGVAPVTDIRGRGIPVGIATDGPASDGRLDLFEEMRLAIRTARLRSDDASALTSHDALTMATSEAAAALGRDDIGSLEPGRWADMVAISVDGSTFTPTLRTDDLITHLVWGASPADVNDVWVGGRRVVTGGECVTLDAAEARREVTARARRLATLP